MGEKNCCKTCNKEKKLLRTLKFIHTYENWMKLPRGRQHLNYGFGKDWIFEHFTMYFVGNEWVSEQTCE